MLPDNRRPWRRARRLLPTVAALALVAGCGRQAAETPPESVALVRAVPVREGSLTATIAAYGTVIPAPGGRLEMAVPFAARVLRVRVDAGQAVARGDTLLDLEPSPEARLEAGQARQAFTAAKQQREATRRRRGLGLATNDDVAKAEQEFADARARRDAVDAWAGQRVVAAADAGIVDRIDVAPGELVPAGGTLLALAGPDRLAVRMGVEPEDAGLVAPGQAVTIAPVGRTADGRTVAGTVRSVARQVSADTRLVPVLVAPADSIASLLLGEFVRGEIAVHSARGLIVPRSALLPDQDRYTLFTVRAGRVTRHLVDLGVQNDSLVAVHDTALAVGDSVVVLGNYELDDGMRVRLKDAAVDSSNAGATAR